MTRDDIYQENARTAKELAGISGLEFAREDLSLPRKLRSTKRVKQCGEPVLEAHRVFADAIISGEPCSLALMASGLGKEALSGRFYVYLLIDPIKDCVFYVGKGKGNRLRSHAKNAKRGRIDNTEKHRAITSITDAGHEVGELVIYGTDAEALAYKVERYLIRSLAECGLTNISNGVRSNAELELEMALDLKRRMMPLEWCIARPDKDFIKVFGSMEKYYYWQLNAINLVIQRAEKELCERYGSNP